MSGRHHGYSFDPLMLVPTNEMFHIRCVQWALTLKSIKSYITIKIFCISADIIDSSPILCNPIPMIIDERYKLD